MSTLTLRLSNGVSLVVPASLRSITTYVLLEQETWFEKELSFLHHWLKPGMTAIDIGANHGVYSVPMARLVGPAGKVFAYEPASEPRGLLEQSRTVNGFDQLRISPFALSDSEREGRLVFGASSELNKLGESGDGETVAITTLDSETKRNQWKPDFIKIDAEGEEEKILAGGKEFFEKHSPLVMHEIEAGQSSKHDLTAAFAALGYRPFRLLNETPMLVPVDPMQEASALELNLFAAKPDRIETLSRSGWLAKTAGTWKPDAAAKESALAALKKQVFAAAMAPLLSGERLRDETYRDCLAAYAASRDLKLSPEDRFAALDFSCRNLASLCKRAPNLPRLSTYARVAWEMGYRSEANQALADLTKRLETSSLDLPEPFWPASPRYDTIDPEGQIGNWFALSIFEQAEKISGFSTYFSNPTSNLARICAHPFVSVEMERRHALIHLRSGKSFSQTHRIRAEAPDHLNAALWREGKIPTG